MLVSCLLLNQNFHAAEEAIMKKAQKHTKAEQIAQETRTYIDEKLLGIDTNSIFRSLAGTYYSYQMANALQKEQDINQELAKIEAFMQPKIKEIADDSFPLLVDNLLMSKHHLFRSLINQRIDEKCNELKRVNGKTLDAHYNDRIEGSSPFKELIHQKALERYAQHKELNNYIGLLPFDNEENEIHQVPLCGYIAYDLSYGHLLMSSNGSYLRGMNNQGNKIFWDMKTGLQAVVNDDSQLIWGRYNEEDHHCKSQRVIDQNQKYLVTGGVAPAFGSTGMRKIIESNEKKYSSLAIMTLFQRPTLKSSLCLDAFLNSQNDPEALQALKDSEVIKKIDGFPAINLKRLIDEKLSSYIQPKL